jgi:hypothetical protein
MRVIFQLVFNGSSDYKSLSNKGKLMKKVLFLLSIMLLLVISTGHADCYYNGKKYPTGTRIGPYVCMPDGTWQ